MKTKRAFLSLEYAVMVVVVVAALVGMSVYLKRAILGRWRDAGDSFGQGRQYALNTYKYPVGGPVPTGGGVGTTGYYQTDNYGGGSEARCYDGDVAVGYWDPGSGDDQVHCAKLVLPEGLCAKIASTYQTNQWGDDNEARCNSGDVATGYWDSGDDQVHCAKLALTKCSPESPDPPSDLCIKTTGIYQTNAYGGGSEARCSDGDVMIGYLDSGDDQVHCAKLIVEKCTP